MVTVAVITPHNVPAEVREVVPVKDQIPVRTDVASLLIEPIIVNVTQFAPDMAIAAVITLHNVPVKIREVLPAEVQIPVRTDVPSL